MSRLLTTPVLWFLATYGLQSYGCRFQGWLDKDVTPSVPLGSMYNDYTHLLVDAPEYPGVEELSQYTTHADFVDNEVVFFNGLTHYDAGTTGKRFTVPWSVFLTDGDYATMRTRLSGNPWLTDVDAVRTSINSIRGDNEVVLYGQFCHYESEELTYTNRMPLPNTDVATWPAEFYVEGVMSFDNPEVVAAYGRLSAFLEESLPAVMGGRSVSDIRRMIADARRYIADEDMAAFGETPIAFAETGYGGWLLTESGEDDFDYMQTSSYDYEQFLYLTHIAKYEYDRSGDHPVAFINNWMVRDSPAWTATGAFTSGLRNAANEPRTTLRSRP